MEPAGRFDRGGAGRGRGSVCGFPSTSATGPPSPSTPTRAGRPSRPLTSRACSTPADRAWAAPIRGATSTTSIPSTEKPDAFRIVLIGDSVVLGHSVGWRQSFGKLLQRKLNQSLPRRRAEVVLLACSGYSTCQELVLLHNEAFRYRPDLILWSYVLNDPADPIYHSINGDLSLVCEPKVHLARLFAAGWFHLRETFSGWDGPTEFHARLHYVYWNRIEAEVGGSAASAASNEFRPRS